jgi:creatinine amidohydrolase
MEQRGRDPKAWGDMTSQEVSEALKETNIVIIPLGAVEQHAGHLPLAMDTYQAEEFARRAIIALANDGRKALIGPSIPFGPVADMRFSGSVNVKPTTMISLIKEICSSLYQHGTRNIILIMGHDETYGAMMVAAQELAEDTADDLKVIVANWLPAIKELETKLLGIPANKRDAHGGAGETARMMWQCPELVQPGKTRDYIQEVTASMVPFGHSLFLGGGIYAPRKAAIQDVAFEGIVGYPSLGIADIGDQLYEAGGRWLAEIIKQNCP